jgi:hypothetical protein
MQDEPQSIDNRAMIYQEKEMVRGYLYSRQSPNYHLFLFLHPSFILVLMCTSTWDISVEIVRNNVLIFVPFVQFSSSLSVDAMCKGSFMPNKGS